MLFFLNEPDADFITDLSMLALFILIILTLGPWWPSQENIERWGENSKLNLPTDNPQVAICVINYLWSAFAFYKVWHTYTEPTKEFYKYERTVFAIAGTNGVIVFWLLLAFVALRYGMVAYRKVRKS